MTRHETIEHLARQLHRLESSRCRPAGLAQQAHGSGVSTGVEALDRLFPRGGLCGGTLIECLSETAGSGTGTLAFVLAQRFTAGIQHPVCGSTEYPVPPQHSVPGTRYPVPGTQHSVPTPPSDPGLSTLDPRPRLVVIDPEGEFYPPAVTGPGIDLEATIVVRPSDRHEALWALEQSLRCSGVAVTLAWLEGFDKLGSQSFRRLALAAETGGLGLLLRPAACRRDISWAHIRLLVQPAPPMESRLHNGHLPSSILHPQSSLNRRLHIHLLRGRKGHVAESLELELRDEPPDPVHLVAPLAHPASAVRATGS